MSAVLRSPSDPGSRQAIVSGRIADAVSMGAIAGYALSLSYDPGGTGDFRALPALLAQRDDGWFAFNIDPAILPPASGDAPALRLAASAPRHASATATLVLTADDVAIERPERTVLGWPIRAPRIARAPFRQDILLAPDPVALEGIVLLGGDPDTPAAGATVTVLDPAGDSVETDPAGRFRIAALPPAARVTLRIVHGADSADHPIRPDPAEPLNRAVFAVPA